ncbi:MAG: glycosyltransferase [candidate division WOR-3 bacterium]
MREVLHIRHHFLPLSETFTYKDITNLKSWKGNVFCLQRLNREIFPFPDIYQPDFWESLSYRLFLRSPTLERLLREKEIRLIHCHLGVEGVYLLPYKRRFSLPLVVSFHGFEFFVPFHKKYKNPTFYHYCQNYRRLAKEGDLFLCVSAATRQDLITIGYPSQKVMTLYLGIDLSTLPKKKESLKKEVKIIFVGRLTEKKGILHLLAAYKRLAFRYPNCHLKVIGDGELRGEVIRRIREDNLGERITYCGALPNEQALREMAESDIFVLPSYKTRDGNQEGTPYTILEAQGIGLPVVSTYHSGIPEIVQDGRTAFLVKERDIKGLEEKLSLLIENPSLRREMGEAGKEFVKNFSLEKRIEKLEEIYAQLTYERS